jgi:hypothetical protein
MYKNSAVRLPVVCTGLLFSPELLHFLLHFTFFSVYTPLPTQTHASLVNSLILFYFQGVGGRDGNWKVKEAKLSTSNLKLYKLKYSPTYTIANFCIT